MGDTSEKENFIKEKQDTIIDCLTKQLSELELFQTMYTPREIVLTNTEVVNNIQDFVAKKSVYSPNHLDYTIKQSVDNLKLEISVHLPSLYPIQLPEIDVRCDQLNRHQQKTLNADLTEYIQRIHDGEVCVFTAILWLQDNIDSFTIKSPILKSQLNDQTEHNFSRYWIYSHHIYSKKKMEEMTKLSKELDLTGFCLMGKPGLVCIEGDEEDCKSWWRSVKTMTWQKIALRITENFNKNDRTKQQKFKSYDIIHFPNAMARGHNDIGSFQKHLEQFGLTDQLTEIFGNQTS